MSASRYVPPTIPSVETGTPPREWSESILASNPAGSDAPAATSETQGLKETTTMDQPSIDQTVVQTAKQSVAEPVGKAVNYATQTAAATTSYLSDPRGAESTASSHLPPEGQERVSLPSTELEGAQPSEHTAGVGALPGNLSESSVALLPEERQERVQESRQRRDTVRPPVASSGIETEPRQIETGEVTADAALSRDEPAASQPSDAFPTESTLARAPETVESSTPASSAPEVESQREVSEKKTQQILGEQDTDTIAAAETPGGVPHGTEEPSEKGQEKGEGSDLASGEHGEEKGRIQGDGEERDLGAKEAEGGYGGDYHPAILHPPPPGASVAEYQSSLGAPQETHDDLPTTKKHASVGAEKKPGFMTMVKGEMKIFAGKMSGDEHKVEEGKKLIHGET